MKILNFISLAERIGLNRSTVISLYKKIDGGYFVTLSYAKPPMLWVLDSWPKKYMSKKLLQWLLTKYDVDIDKTISLFVSLDVYILHLSSALLLDLPLNSRRLQLDIQEVFNKIREKSKEIGVEINLEEAELKTDDVYLFAKEIVDKRRKEINGDLIQLLNDIANESEFVNELKTSVSWFKSISRENLLKALRLENKLDEFIDHERLKILYLIASKSLFFDRQVIDKGINTAIEIIRNQGEELKDLLETEIKKIKEYVNYF